VGTSALVLLATVDIQIAVLYLLGVIGTAYFFDIESSPRYRDAAGAALGTGLLFLGLQLIHEGAQPAGELEGFRLYLEALSEFEMLLLLASVAVTIVLQSSSTVSVIAVTMAGAGLLDLQQALVVITGANTGSGLSVLLMSAGQAGSTRRLALVQVETKLVASLMGLLLLFAERYLGVPGVIALGHAAGLGTPAHGAAYFVALQLMGALLAMAFDRTFLALAGRFSPESHQETLARPRYISAQALEESTTALELLELEQTRLLGHVGCYLSATEPSARLLAEEPAASHAAAPELAEADALVGAQVAIFMGALADRYHDAHTGEQLLRLQERLRGIQELGAAVRELDTWLLRIDTNEDPNREHCLNIKVQVRESCHFLLEMLYDTTASRSDDDLGILDLLVHDRSDVMNGLRKGWLQQAATTGQPMLEALFAATSLFERTVWIVRRVRQTLRAAAA
jgi:phosphate:Na+ symporter